ncbi:helix-turn-helix transcriptional regulator [Reinekea sp. G2M2-21]|uniref:helix-turn-helix transcriptional regulator n=1 Tax=Reinekea sp. G2M2-21 TaxID=2788942 RepID=UPI0018AC0B06
MISTLMYAGSIQGLFVTVVLLMQRHRDVRFARLPLAALTGLLSYDLFMEALYFSRDILAVPHATATEFPINLLYGPALWWYCYTATRQQPPRLWHSWQLLPALLTVVLLLPFYRLTATEKSAHLQALFAQPAADADSMFLWALLILSGLVYSVICWRMVRRYQQQLPDQISYQQTRKVGWLVSLTATFAVIWVSGLMQWSLLLLAQSPSEFAFTLPNLAYALALYAMGYLAIKNPAAMFGDVDVHVDRTETAPTERESEKPTFQLSPERRTSIAQRMDSAMNDKQLFLNPALKLRDLADFIRAPEHHLSMVIKDVFQENFFSYVNGYRIQHAKQLLADSTQQHLNMLDIALSCGYNAKSTFYTQFKAREGITPLQYRQNQISG